MSKRALKKSKRRSKAVIPVLGITGLSLSLAGGATASTGEASTSQPHELFIGEEEIFDSSLSTFFTFDKENGEPTSLAQQVKLAARGGCVARGCAAGFRGCAAGFRGCAGVRGFGRCAFHVHCRCAFFRRCFGCGCSGCGGCGGWGCGTCWIWTPTWGWINTCWSESTPAGEETRVASEPMEQIAAAEEKK